MENILGDGYNNGLCAKGGNKSSGSKASSQATGDGESSNFEESEIAVILEFVEENYKSLYGHGSGTEIKAKKDKKWKEFVDAVNRVYKGAKHRTKTQIYNKIDNIRSATKKHRRAWIKHKTGGGPAPAPITPVDQVMVRIFGNTPAFAGILDLRFDTPIEVTEDADATIAEAKRCGSKLLPQGSTVAKTLSTDEIIDCEEVLAQAQEIRKKRQDNGAGPSVVTVDPVIKFEVNPTAEQVALADAPGTSTAAIPTQGGVVILLESSKDTEETAEKSKGKNRRKEEEDVQIINEPTVRFPDYLNQAPPIDTTMENLCKHVLIAQVNYYNASTRFFNQASVLLPHVKRLIADFPMSHKNEPDSTEKADHGYAFPTNNTESDTDV